jgi:hypothetical protein
LASRLDSFCHGLTAELAQSDPADLPSQYGKLTRSVSHMRRQEVFVMPVTAMRQTVAVVCLTLFAAALPTIAAGQSVLIDFEQFPGPDGIIGTADDIPAPPCSGPSPALCFNLSNEFSSMGLTFTSGTLFQASLFPGTALTNHFLSSPITDGMFSRPVTGVSITSYSFWTATLYALDENNNVIASDTLTNPNAGSSFFLGTLSVSLSRPIRRFVVLPAGCQIGASQCNPILNLDNLILIEPAVGPQGIPTISGWGMLALVVLLGTAGALAMGGRPGAGG